MKLKIIIKFIYLNHVCLFNYSYISDKLNSSDSELRSKSMDKSVIDHKGMLTN